MQSPGVPVRRRACTHKRLWLLARADARVRACACIEHVRRAFVPVERKLLEAALRLVPPPFAVLCARCLPLSHRSPTACAARVRSYRSHSCDLHVDRRRNCRCARASACAKRRPWITAVRLRVVWRAPHCAPACCGANVRCRVVPCGRCGRVVRCMPVGRAVWQRCPPCGRLPTPCTAASP